MTAILLDGAATAMKIRAEVAEETHRLVTQYGVTPGLGTILVGDDPASDTYVGAKRKACAQAGIASIHTHLPADSIQADVLRTIAEYNANPAVHSYIVQLPLPKGLNEEEALLAVDPDKDADGLHPINLGRLVMGTGGPIPCTPAGIVELLAAFDVPVVGKHVVVVGRGLTIGRPISLLLTLKRPHCNAAVTVVHTGVKDIASYTRQADVIIAAAGSPGIVKPEMVKPGAAVVGAGITRVGKNTIVSDVEESVAEVAGWVTPRIGGVGPMTIAMLLKNTVTAARIAASSPTPSAGVEK